MLGTSHRGITANFFTPSYRVVGKIEVKNSGLIGLLNDPTTSFLQINGASMARVHDPKTLVDKSPFVRMVKYGLVAVTLARRDEVGPEAIRRGGLTGTFKPHPIRVVTASYEFDGTLEWPGRLDFNTLLTSGPSFVPLYDVKFRSILYPDLVIECDAMIFNRRKVDIITLDQLE